MRKGMFALFVTGVILVVFISIIFLPKREPASFAAVTTKNLVNNGVFQDGLNGWQLETSGVKPQYDFVQIPDAPASALALVAEQKGSARLSQ